MSAVPPPPSPSPRPPLPLLPNPGVTTNGMVACNARHPELGIYCDRLVKRDRSGAKRPHRRHRHRFEWSAS